MATATEPSEVQVRCETCGAEMIVPADRKTANCPYCASPAVVERPPTADRPAPNWVVPFLVDGNRAADLVRRWVRRSSVFARSGFKSAIPSRTHGLYLPAYLYNATANSTYKAQIGENYTVTETYTTTDSKGNTQTHTRTVVKTEHRRLSGPFTCYLVDVVVTASKGIENEELEAIEPFDLRALTRYEPALLSGWMAEEPTVSPDECLKNAHAEGVRMIGRKLNSFMPGDSHHALEHQTELTHEEVALCLLPVWVFALRYDPDQPVVRILVNGQTGEVGGKVPRSALKITLTILVVVAVIVLAALVIGGAL